MQVRLTYNRRRLIIAAAFLLTTGIGGIMYAISPREMHGGPLGLVAFAIGQQGAKLFFGGISTLAAFGAARSIWLAFNNASAAEIERRGIRLRSFYYSGLLPWEAITSISLRDVRGWGKYPVLVFDHSRESPVLLRLVGQGNMIVIPPKLLNADYDKLDAWIDAAIEATNNRGPSYQPGKRAAPMVQQPIVQQRPVFGKRR